MVLEFVLFFETDRVYSGIWWCFCFVGVVHFSLSSTFGGASNAMVAERLEIEERRYSNTLGMRLVQVKDSKSDWILISWQRANWWRDE